MAISKKKIAYIGNRKNLGSDGKSFNTENHIALTLEDLGHEVIFLQEDELQPDWVNNLEQVDLVLYTRTWGNFVTLEHLEQLKERGIPTASYHLDLYVGLKRENGLDNDPFWRTDYVFTPDGDANSAEVFKRKNINHYYIKPAVFKDECYISDKRQEKQYDLVFVGGGVLYGHPEWPYRQELVKFLQNTYGDGFYKFGYPEKTVRGEELNDLYANSKIVIGDSICLPYGEYTHTHYWSDRIYETMGRGGFIIHPYIKGLEEEFTDNVNCEFYTYGDFEELKRTINYYLANDDKREKIRLAGHEKVKKDCTYHNRLQQVLEIIFNEGVEKISEIAIGVLPKRISLGCGLEPETGDDWLNLDLVSLPNVDIVHNLMNFPYPLEDESMEYIKAKDIIEHLDHYTVDGKPSIIAFVEECYRILKKGGTLWIQTPSWDSDFLWIDPTHVRGFDYRSFDFFDPTTDFGKATGFYSEAKFKVESKVLENKNLQFTMVKI